MCFLHHFLLSPFVPTLKIHKRLKVYTKYVLRLLHPPWPRIFPNKQSQTDPKSSAVDSEAWQAPQVLDTQGPSQGIWPMDSCPIYSPWSSVVYTDFVSMGHQIQVWCDQPPTCLRGSVTCVLVQAVTAFCSQGHARL